MGNDLSLIAQSDNGRAEKEKASSQRKGGGGRLERLDSALTKFVQQGVDYSLRVLIKGDIATGKSSLVSRVKGQPFSETIRRHGTGPVEVRITYNSWDDDEARYKL